MQLFKQWLSNDAVDSSKVRFLNNTNFRMNNLAGTATNIFTYNASDIFQFLVPVDMNSQKITGLGAPSADTDASTKKYVDDAIGGIAAGANQALSNLTSPTSVNQNLIPQSGMVLGSSSARWGAFLNQAQLYDYADFKRASNGVTFLNIAGNQYMPDGSTQVKSLIHTGWNTLDGTYRSLGIATDSTDQAHTGAIQIATGNANATNLNSGAIVFKTGNITGGTGVKGAVIIDALNLNMSSKKIVSLADPTANQDAATKYYVDSAVVGALVYQGTFDASAGDYTAITNPLKGWFYIVTVAGTISGIDWQVGDNLVINKNVTGNPVAADVDKIDNTEAPDILRTSDLSSAKIFVGSSSNLAAPVDMSGDATISNTGALSLAAGIKKTWARESFTLDATDISNKYVTLANVPINESVLLLISGAGVQLYGLGSGYDYHMDGTSTDQLAWDSNALDGVLSAGDVIQVMYQY